jgi:hypothetical protein
LIPNFVTVIRHFLLDVLRLAVILQDIVNSRLSPTCPAGATNEDAVTSCCNPWCCGSDSGIAAA